MSNGRLKSILMATTLLLLIAATLSAGCIGGSDETKSEEPTPQVPLDITYDGDIHKKSNVVVIHPGVDGDGYSWSGSTVTISGSGEYELAAEGSFSDNMEIRVTGPSVRLDGNNVPISGIRGQPDLDLKNIQINRGNIVNTYSYGFLFTYGVYGITACRNIESSFIVVEGTRAHGIGTLYGNIDDTTTITVIGKEAAIGVADVFGVVSGGEFTVTGAYAQAVNTVAPGGVVSGGEFSVTGTHTASGVGSVSGVISGGELTVTGDGACGVEFISGDEFPYLETRVGSVPGVISGGTFTVNGKRVNY